MLKCITEHPGFRPVCLEKWSLRLASGKYRTRDKQSYKKTGSEERCDDHLLRCCCYCCCFCSRNEAFSHMQVIYRCVYLLVGCQMFCCRFLCLWYIIYLFCRYLRSIAYREFSRLVYGFMGKKRIPLPACAYTAIRKTFPLQEDESLTGFELEDY